MFSTKLLPFFIIALLSFSAYSSYFHNDPNEPKCVHKRFNSDPPGLVNVQEEFLSNQTRFLQTGSYPNLRITSDYSLFVNGTQDFKTYVKTQLLPPVISYYQEALGVKQPLSSPLKLPSSYKSICGYTTPKTLFTGVPTDFYLIVTSTEDSTENWVASGGSCYLSTTTKRPVIARMMFNMYYTKATTDVLVHEKNMYLTLHEMTHALGFTGSSFKNFIDANGKTLTGHIKSVMLNGSSRTVLDLEPLTSKLRTHFGCSTLPGAFLEDDGGAGTEGSHFERRHFMYETMTSGVIHGRRMSEFSLRVLEGSGWYQPNYTYAEPFYFGKGEGCNFLYQTCTSTTFNFDEFCKGNGRGCTAVGRGGGLCSTDTRSDGCAYYIPTLDYDCQEPSSVDNARLPTVEVFGRSAGSRCFTGTLSKTSSMASQTSMCFKFTCNGSGSTTTLDVTLGTTKATCKKAGPLKVSGYNGNLDCPDPLTYCTTVGLKYCPRNCMGRGKCVNNQCVCNTGFTGIDCGIYGQLTAISS